MLEDNVKEMKQGSSPRRISMMYTNYRKETSLRMITPFGIYWGTTQWHPEPGWLLQAFDVDKGEKREFALVDCDFTAPTKIAADEIKCTCLSELAYDAYGPGGPSSGQPLPPPCVIHSKKG